MAVLSVLVRFRPAFHAFRIGGFVVGVLSSSEICFLSCSNQRYSTLWSAFCHVLKSRVHFKPRHLLCRRCRALDKCLVFSQWDDMLDIVEMAFKENGVRYGSWRLHPKHEPRER